MDYSEIQSLMARVDRYITESRELIEQGNYEALVTLEQEYADLSEDLRDVPADKVQLFAKEMQRFSVQLTQTRDIMMRQRDTIREQLSQMEGSANAAKAYVKSSYTSDSES